jgi:Dehydrogenases with different specificities (related to short-chain alcohol dehydrogenases)
MNLMQSTPQLLTNKFAVVTGASSGIGFETALEFCQQGAAVIGVGRDAERCKQAQAKILAQVPGASIHFLIANLSKQHEVRRLAEEIVAVLQQQGMSGLDILVNNAGTFMDKLALTEDGIETTIAVNHLAPFLLSNLLLPQLAARPDSRVITVSSGSHYRTWLNPARLRRPLIFNSLWAYKVSKLANVLFSLEWNQRRQGAAPHAFAVDPGLVNTEIGLKGTGALASFIWKQRQKAGVATSVPAATILHVATDAEAAKSPEVYWYLSAPMTPSRAARDARLARALWQESARLCGINE